MPPVSMPAVILLEWAIYQAKSHAVFEMITTEQKTRGREIKKQASQTLSGKAHFFFYYADMFRLFFYYFQQLSL